VSIKPVNDTQALVTHLLAEDLLMHLYHAVVESAMSEQLARIAAMRMAGDNARKLCDQLTRQYNLARQHTITESLLEIVSGYQATLADAAPLDSQSR
jgi:F-type H+-transporting ATPase subunit gamma